jgi:hypothetical protein
MNELIVSGSSEELRYFREAAEGKAGLIDMQKMRPVENEIEAFREWGVQAPITHVELLYDFPYQQIFNYRSHNVPPLNFVLNMSEMFPNLTFFTLFARDGTEIWGRALFQNGTLLHLLGSEVLRRVRIDAQQSKKEEIIDVG